MIPTSFAEANVVLDKPSGMSRDECTALSVLSTTLKESGIPVVVSCWKLTAKELKEMARTGRVWLVVCGDTMPPVMLSGVKDEVFLS